MPFVEANTTSVNHQNSNVFQIDEDPEGICKTGKMSSNVEDIFVAEEQDDAFDQTKVAFNCCNLLAQSL